MTACLVSSIHRAGCAWGRGSVLCVAASVVAFIGARARTDSREGDREISGNKNKESHLKRMNGGALSAKRATISHPRAC
eukprot:scaffold5390_cov116-Isochrysis_galbana.AAC.8